LHDERVAHNQADHLRAAFDSGFRENRAEIETELARHPVRGLQVVFVDWPEWLAGVNTVGLTAGASAPEILVQEAVAFLEEQGFTNMREVEVMPENVRFGLPPEIVEAIAAAPAAAE